MSDRGIQHSEQNIDDDEEYLYTCYVSWKVSISTADQVWKYPFAENDVGCD